MTPKCLVKSQKNSGPARGYRPGRPTIGSVPPKAVRQRKSLQTQTVEFQTIAKRKPTSFQTVCERKHFETAAGPQILGTAGIPGSKNRRMESNLRFLGDGRGINRFPGAVDGACWSLVELGRARQAMEPRRSLRRFSQDSRRSNHWAQPLGFWKDGRGCQDCSEFPLWSKESYNFDILVPSGRN